MNFDDNDLEWALGELLHMIGKANRARVPPHEYDPELFFECMHVIGLQPFAVRVRIWPTLQAAHPYFARLILYANSVAH